MRQLLLALCAILIPGQTLALSCMAPNMADTFNQLDAAEETYVLGYGTLTAAGVLPDMPQTGEAPAGGQTVTAEFQFDGRFMGRQTLGLQRSVSVRVSVSCLSVWCGQFPRVSGPALMFLHKAANDSYELSFGACPNGGYLPGPSEAQLAAMQSCMRKGSCGEQEAEVMSPF